MSGTTKAIKEQVKDYYDTVGWRRQDDQLFADLARFEDLRPVSAKYRVRCHRRLKRFLSGKGKFLLDVASGPVQTQEYLTYSEGYDYHVCADLSLTALQEARLVLGRKGLYVQCDITQLPIKSDSIAGFVSLHTIYHVPAEEQPNAFLELQRILEPGRTGVVVYKWANSLLMGVTMPFVLVLGAAKRGLTSLRAGQPTDQEPKLYFHAHKLKWLERALAGKIAFDLAVWRSVSLRFLKLYVHPWLFGEKLLDFVFWLEERYPRLMGKVGEYPIFVLRKPIET